MKCLKSTAAALLAVLALGAVVATTAQAEEAPFWFVAGTRLAAGQTRFITAKEEAPFVLKASSTKVTVTCSTVEVLPHAVILGSAAGEPGTNDETITLKTCKVEGNGSECKVTEPINTTNLKSELVEDKTKAKLLVLFQPASGTTLAELKFSKGCTTESTKVTGSFVTEVLTDPEEEAVELSTGAAEDGSWLLRLPETQPTAVWLVKGGEGKEVELKGLEAFGVKATLTGTALVSLEDGEEWDGGIKFIPRVLPLPNEFNFKTFMVGGANPPKKTIIYENKGPGKWTATGVGYDRLRGDEDPFAVKNGTKKCVNVEVDETCEIIYEFIPVAEEFYLGNATAEPDSRPLTLEGEGT
jgi:hypothetical protein